jgi:hypothetical protein
MRITIICPVRSGVPHEVLNHVKELEFNGNKVYLPSRDTPQADNTGYEICLRMAQAIRLADEIHVWYDSKSQGSLWDLGGAFILGKPIKLINKPEDTEGKSYIKVIKQIEAYS